MALTSGLGRTCGGATRIKPAPRILIHISVRHLPRCGLARTQHRLLRLAPHQDDKFWFLPLLPLSLDFLVHFAFSLRLLLLGYLLLVNGYQLSGNGGYLVSISGYQLLGNEPLANIH
jgi:hypothetical protein